MRVSEQNCVPTNAHASIQSRVLQDPSIKEMAEKIAQDPSFAQMAQAMQANMGAMMGGAGGPPPAPTGRGASGASADESGLPGGMPGMPGMDPSAYANMMSGVLQNPQFVEMAEKLGQQIMQVSALYMPWYMLLEQH